jgi:hypothetical protein
MSRKSGNKFRRSLPSARTLSLRFFIEEKKGKWKAISFARIMAIQNGHKRNPEHAGSVLRSAEAKVEVEGRKVVSLVRLSISEWLIDESGFVDQPNLMNQIVSKIDGGAEKELVSSQDEVAIRNCLRLFDSGR